MNDLTMYIGLSGNSRAGSSERGEKDVGKNKRFSVGSFFRSHWCDDIHL
jgi:hypothetical protein